MEEIVKVNFDSSGILHLSLARPTQLNALSHEMLERLLHLFRQAKKDASVKALLLTGEGKGFCAGADIKQLAALQGQEGLAFAALGQSVLNELEDLGKPSLAAIHGFAFGGGCELAMAATLRIASDSAQFGQPEIKLGVMPGFGGTQRLARLIGLGRALDLCLSGRRFSAEQAFQWGLISEMTSTADLLNKANQILLELTKLSPFAIKSIITVIQQGHELPLKEAFELEAAYFGLCCGTLDKEEGVNAFLEKREPIFTGR